MDWSCEEWDVVFHTPFNFSMEFHLFFYYFRTFPKFSGRNTAAKLVNKTAAVCVSWRFSPGPRIALLKCGWAQVTDTDQRGVTLQRGRRHKKDYAYCDRFLHNWRWPSWRISDRTMNGRGTTFCGQKGFGSAQLLDPSNCHCHVAILFNGFSARKTTTRLCVCQDLADSSVVRPAEIPFFSSPGLPLDQFQQIQMVSLVTWSRGREKKKRVKTGPGTFLKFYLQLIFGFVLVNVQSDGNLHLSRVTFRIASSKNRSRQPSWTA